MSVRKTAAAPVATGDAGLDELLEGGLRAGAANVVLGGPGDGKTVLAMQFLHHAAARGESGIVVSFEEGEEELRRNVGGFEWPAPAAGAAVHCIDATHAWRTSFSGDFDVQGLLASAGALAGRTGSRALVIDGLDHLLANLDAEHAIRREVSRLLSWVEDVGLTCVLTAKSAGADRRTTLIAGLLQFGAGCVLSLTRHLHDGVPRRAVRVVKYRGGSARIGEHPMVIGPAGVQVVRTVDEEVRGPALCGERVSSGVERLDTMLRGGYLHGSSVLVSGAPGTAKSTLAGAFVDAACRRGERALYLSFDEHAAHLLRHFRAVGIDLAPHVRDARLRLFYRFSGSHGVHDHVAHVQREVEAFGPACAVVDPISAINKDGDRRGTSSAAETLIHWLRARGVTVLMTSLAETGATMAESTRSQVSTVADTWIHLEYAVHQGERNRTLTIVKARGIAHSNQVRELVLGDSGVTLEDVRADGDHLLLGAARLRADQRAEEARTFEEAEYAARLEELADQRRGLEAETERLQRRTARLERREQMLRQQTARRVEAREQDRRQMLRKRSADAADGDVSGDEP